MNHALFTPVTASRLPSVTPDSHILLLGSCFTDSVGACMEQGGLDTLRNPFGVVYNPLSVATCLEHCLDDRPIDIQMLVQHDGLWHSWLHHTTLSHPDRDICLQQCNARIAAAHVFLQGCDTIIITWGTAYAYYLTAHPADDTTLADPLPVANCHKVSARHFDRRRLTVEQITALWQPLLQRLMQLPRQPQIIFTVSPIRHLADSAHGNQLSKATLHLALDTLLTRTDNCSYFPAYEIMMDELRDYRFYDRDMVHPSELAVDIIWQRFQQTYLTAAAVEHCRRSEQRQRQNRHRPISKI
ncbi:MAG: GSCFA family protein [bacterium P3]|nr:MAG: GSCFA family protein [bacterium P3]KWW42463.1 MAG: GSCFA family protein [bacterium F083]